MTACLELLRFLEEGRTELPPELAAHVAACPACTALMAAWPEVAGAGQTVRRLQAPPSLVARLAAIPRLPLACEQACEAFGAVLDREATPEQRKALLEHLAHCPACRATWDTLAAVKQTGEATKAPASVLPHLVAVPLPRVESQGGRRWRLAAAAVYILAGTIFLVSGSGEIVGRQAVAKISDAFFYGRAAVTNRVRWAQKEVKAWFFETQKLARDSLSKALSFWQETLSPREQNPNPQKHVQEHEEEGRT